MIRLSLVIPVYNEKNFIRQTLQRLAEVFPERPDFEIIIVDDGSTDGTAEILRQLAGRQKVIFHQNNRGKGAALKTGFAAASGEIIAIQDADLEYNPVDLNKLIAPITDGKAQAVYGSRMAGNNPVGHWRYYFGNWLISKLTKILYGGNLTDIETGYKVFKRCLLDKINIQSAGFGFEAEFTAKLLKNKIPVQELPISYAPRKFNEGKKIGWWDGIWAIWLLIKCRF